MVKDLKAFIEVIGKDEALQAKMKGIMDSSTQENMFANCNAVAKEMGYDIEKSDLMDLADELDVEMDEVALNKVAGGTEIASIVITGLLFAGVMGLAAYKGALEKG